MKMFGKYEKIPEGAAAKQPKVKSVLLQTYLTSLLCMVLCVSMFLSTSYAWFTSEVSNQMNEIYVGTLKVGLYKEDTNLANSGKLFDGGIHWEPGYTTLETIQVLNEGDLAFRYTLNFTDGTAENGGNLADIAGCFEVWVFSHQDNAYTKPDSYEAITEENGWVHLGTLEQVLSGKAVLENKRMDTVRQNDSTVGENAPNATGDGVRTAHTYTIALHMNEDAGSPELMGQKISLNVKLVAHQLASEKDSFENSDYDNVCFVSTAQELQAALGNKAGACTVPNL